MLLALASPDELDADALFGVDLCSGLRTKDKLDEKKLRNFKSQILDCD